MVKEIEWVPGEVLDDGYPVFGDYLYFADDRLTLYLISQESHLIPVF